MTNQISADPIYFFERGSGPPLLLVHGLMVSGEMFETVVEQFAKRHRVVVPDLRGHGRSRNLPPPYTARQLAADLAELLDRLGIHSAAVLGYSQGGAIAQQFALDYPDRCSRLVLACTYAFNMASLREKLEGHLVPLALRILGMRRFARFVITLGAGYLAPERAEWMVRLMAEQDRDLMLSAWNEMIVFDSRSRLATIKCPTLILAAANDRAVPMHHATILHRGIPGSRLVVVAGADHTLIWIDPGELVRLTEEFLKT